MLLIECRNLKKYYEDRLILAIENLNIYSEDRIGIVGVNGVGKTTLINILSKRLESDTGVVKLYGKHSYISQLQEPEGKTISKEMAEKFRVASVYNENSSGGEKTRFKLARAFDDESQLIFADEPTSNLDIDGIELLEQKFQQYKGALVIISHDRSFLDKICNKIMEIEEGKIKIYNGNFSDYINQKLMERQRAEFEYSQYTKEKRRLENTIIEISEKSKGMRKAPKRMGNSEARLHRKMGNQKSKAKLDKTVKAIESRIDHLEVKDKPRNQEIIKLDFSDSNMLHSKVVIEGKSINRKYDKKVIFKDAEFYIENNSKVALIGPNGCGKSTLIKMIINNKQEIKISKAAKIGYFSQDLKILDENLTIIEDVMKTSIQSENYARLLLARLLFKGDAVYKRIGVLSGGEKVKVAFAKVLLQDINLLILDEPTNYMDITSLEVVEEALCDYDRSILFVSHDRSFIKAVADNIMTIENYKIKVFKGNYNEYLAKKNNPVKKRNEISEQILIMQNRLSEIMGRLSMPSKKDDVILLDKEYYEVLKELNTLKARL
ncbi:ribosomal protection-like ABC-F family protein [Clostridium cellulovorans]|uniref:ABC transporter related n=1 Tax=Clostridium cellulovorans (strain ATCC 35296 / DSM 3052 / OCM 3 / 743B) TaxID=573061 RepID=D9SUS2_CLOC7|nr:ABC-F type ribosomal protection protein [Clostridium cellulovorans]ADL50977.1 ABC transporter related [Clostridium cellulovorans 743B]